MSLTQAWANFVVQLTHEKELIVAGVQRIHPNIHWWVSSKDFFDDTMTLKETGYTKSKISMLSKHYAPQNLERAIADIKWRIEKRKYGSGVIYFNGEPKKNTKQDFCMTAMIVTYFPGLNNTRITVYYRTAESIKRFRGDLVYLKTVILPHFKEIFEIAPPTGVFFEFANITLHPMYWVLMLEHVPNWSQVLSIVKNDNPKLFRAIAYWCWRYLLDTSKSIDSYSSARQVRIIAEKCTKPKTLERFKDWLKPILIRDTATYPVSVQEWVTKCVTSKISKRR